MWFIPLLIIGALTIAAVSRSPRESTFLPPRQLPPPPGPIAVLGEFVRIGQTPPPTVILCAIAEAETIGRNDLASDIVRVFVAPVVYQHELEIARRANPSPARTHGAQAVYERGSCAIPRSPRDVSAAPSPEIIQPPLETTHHATDEEILAMINSDPRGFIEMAKRAPMIEAPTENVFSRMALHRAAAIEVPVEAARRSQQSLQSMQLPAPLVQPSMTAPTQLSQEEESTGLPAEAVAQMQEAVGLHEAADQTRALVPGSPLPGVSDGAWREFVMRLERESPQFNSSRHVGQYRQHRDRLAELGIDSNALLGSAQAQRAALDADLVDAHHHASEGGLISEHLARMIMVPGHEGSASITLSGVLGVIQCAGLEGAVGWLERPTDRKRYPHTTQAFLRTNGVF